MVGSLLSPPVVAVRDVDCGCYSLRKECQSTSKRWPSCLLWKENHFIKILYIIPDSEWKICNNIFHSWFSQKKYFYIWVPVIVRKICFKSWLSKHFPFCEVWQHREASQKKKIHRKNEWKYVYKYSGIFKFFEKLHSIWSKPPFSIHLISVVQSKIFIFIIKSIYHNAGE